MTGNDAPDEVRHLLRRFYFSHIRSHPSCYSEQYLKKLRNLSCLLQVSIIAKQQGNTLVGYETEACDHLEMLYMGKLSPQVSQSHNLVFGCQSVTGEILCYCITYSEVAPSCMLFFQYDFSKYLDMKCPRMRYSLGRLDLQAGYSCSQDFHA